MVGRGHFSTRESWGSANVKDGKEVDLIIEQDNTLHPVEIKKAASPGRSASRGFSGLERLGRNIGPGAIICLRESPVAISANTSANVTAIPASYI